MKMRAIPLLFLTMVWSLASGQHPEYVVEADLKPDEIDVFFLHLEAEGVENLRQMQRTHIIESLEPNAGSSFEAQILSHSEYRTVRIRASRGEDDTITLRIFTYSERFAAELDGMVRRYFGEEEPEAPDLTT